MLKLILRANYDFHEQPIRTLGFQGMMIQNRGDNDEVRVGKNPYALETQKMKGHLDCHEAPARSTTTTTITTTTSHIKLRSQSVLSRHRLSRPLSAGNLVEGY